MRTPRGRFADGPRGLLVALVETFPRPGGRGDIALREGVGNRAGVREQRHPTHRRPGSGRVGVASGPTDRRDRLTLAACGRRLAGGSAPLCSGASLPEPGWVQPAPCCGSQRGDSPVPGILWPSAIGWAGGGGLSVVLVGHQSSDRAPSGDTIDATPTGIA